MTTAQIQQALNDAGYGPLVVDGKNGPKTQAAVRAYQQANGLAVDGVAGPQTQAKLGSGTSAPAATTPASQSFQDRYPQFAWAFNDPEVAAILNAGVANKSGPDEIQGQIQQTNWWKSKTDAERAWLQTLATDPAEATRRLNDYDQISKYTKLSADYGLPITFEAAARQVDRVVRGEVGPDALEQEMRNQAKALYPQLAQQIDAGSTVADVYAPYKQMAASLLGINPDTIDLSDPKWQTPLQLPDKQGNRRLATTDEWQRTLRTDARFGYDQTSTGRQEASQFATQLGQTFGAIG